MSNVFHDALLVGRRSVQILWADVQPFSPWHYAVLDALGSPYVHGGDVSEHDLALALLVCASSRKDSIDWQDVAVFVRVDERVDEAIKRYSVEDRQAAFDKFAAYITAGSRSPKIFVPAKSQGHSGVHFSWLLVCSVSAAYGIPASEAWDMPIVELNCYRAHMLEGQGCRVADPTRPVNDGATLSIRLSGEALEQFKRDNPTKGATNG